MKDKIKLIVTDLDGTFLSDDKTVPQINLDAVKACREAGIHVCPCSARNIGMLSAFIREAGFDGLCMGCNGGFIFPAATGEVFRSVQIAPELVEPAVRVMLKYGNKMSAMTNRSSARYGFSKEEMAARKGMSVMEDSGSVENFINTIREECNLLSVWMDHEQHLPLYTDLSDIGDFELSAADLDHVHIMAGGATKGSACAAAAEYYGIGPENIMCFGDGKNDLSMLYYAGVAVAMENGMVQAKEAADYIAPNNNEGGFGKAVFKLVFGEDR